MHCTICGDLDHDNAGHGTALKRAVDRLAALPPQPYLAQWDEQIVKLHAENARLRLALNKIVARQDKLAAKIDRNDFESGYRQGTEQCSYIAEEALEYGQEPPDPMRGVEFPFAENH